MAAPALIGLERAQYRVELPINCFGSDLLEAMFVAPPLASAFTLQALWYTECATALQQLAVVAEEHTLDIEVLENDVRVTGPVAHLDSFEFLTRIIPDEEN